VNSREKGCRGERQFAALLREHGYEARRGQQFSGSPDSPDVVCEDLAPFHIETKLTEAFRLWDALAQARHDAGDKIPVVAHRRNRTPWVVVLQAEDFFRLLRAARLEEL
jgi:Holliday junction resolvase